MSIRHVCLSFMVFFVVSLLPKNSYAQSSNSNQNPLPLSSSNWTASAVNGNFADTGVSGQQQIALVLPRNSEHFKIFLTGFQTNLPEGTAVDFTVTFDGSKSMSFSGVSEASTVQADLGDAVVAEWTHNMTAGHMMAISFTGIQESPWMIPLSGTTATITAMATGIRLANIDSLPGPWNIPPPTSTADAQLSRGYLCVVAAPVTLQIAQNFGFPSTSPSSDGAIILNISPGGPAAQAGFQPNDLITSFDGKDVTNPSDLIQDLSNIAVGQPVVVGYTRNGSSFNVNVSLSPAPCQQENGQQNSEPAQKASPVPDASSASPPQITDCAAYTAYLESNRLPSNSTGDFTAAEEKIFQGYFNTDITQLTDSEMNNLVAQTGSCQKQIESQQALIANDNNFSREPDKRKRCSAAILPIRNGM